MKVFFAENCDDCLNVDGVDYDVLFVSYETGWYEGFGYALGVKNGKVFGGGLGHCSCYEPEERLQDMSEVNMEDESVLGELAEMEQDVHGSVVLEMYRKYMAEV